MLLGIFTLSRLSFEQYPFLAPPTIRVTATYPGASAVAVEQSVATPIEQEVNGVDRMIYMQSSNTSDGRMQVDVNFEVGVDQDTANVLTQNRVTSAQARLPQEVIAQGVTVKKQSPSILMIISVYSPGESYDANYLINYCGINLRDQILRIPGVAQVDLFGGADYGMRIWLRPDKLAKLGLTPADVISSIKEQNLQAPAGRVGAAPAPKDQQFTYTVSAPSRLVTTEEFENIIIRGTQAGPRSASGTWGARSSAPRATTPSAGSTASPPGPWPYTSCPGPTSFRRRMRSTRPWRGPRDSSRRTWTTSSSTTLPRPSRRRSTRS